MFKSSELKFNTSELKFKTYEHRFLGGKEISIYGIRNFLL